MNLGQQLSNHGTELALAVSKGTAIGGMGTTVGAGVAQKTGILAILSMPGPEVVNACAIGGFVVGTIGVLVNIGINWYYKRRKFNAETGQYPVVPNDE